MSTTTDGRRVGWGSSLAAGGWKGTEGRQRPDDRRHLEPTKESLEQHAVRRVDQHEARLESLLSSLNDRSAASDARCVLVLASGQMRRCRSVFRTNVAADQAASGACACSLSRPGLHPENANLKRTGGAYLLSPMLTSFLMDGEAAVRPRALTMKLPAACRRHQKLVCDRYVD
ncbi:hypothetical protein VTK26DRAFT_3400 [Humicola hyalothermophila]